MDADAAEAAIARLAEDQLGTRVERIDWLAGQLGLRRFGRVHLAKPGLEASGVATLVARLDAPEDPAGRPAGVPPEPPLEPMRALYEAAGLPVPARYGGDPAAGIELLEDVGDVPLGDYATRVPDAERRSLYEEACDLVPRIQAIGPADVEAFRRHLDATLFAYKAELFAEHALAARGRGATAAERQDVRDGFAFVAAESEAAPQRLAHRDFQSANLHLRTERPPGARIVMIDLQGAFLAPPEYDLVCLLRDSYVTLSDAEVEHQIARIRPELPDAPDEESFSRRFDLLTLTRKGKDLARFLYAAQDRGDARYLVYVEETLRVLREAARRSAERDPALAPLADLIHQIPETPCEP